jgi:FAD:protein FMN transferase
MSLSFLLPLLYGFKTKTEHLQTRERVLLLMGSRFEISAVSESSVLAEQAVDAAIDEIGRIEKLISSWDNNSQTSKINHYAGKKAIKVDEELFLLIERSKKISRLTGGMFDISYASLDKIWVFDSSYVALPSADVLKKAVSRINYENIITNARDTTVFLKEKGMKIGFGAIGKGFAANKAKQKMLSMGIMNGVVNAGGDLLAWGRQEDSQPWKVGISDPRNKERIIAWLEATDRAIVTSGNYERFIEIAGVRYGHILNPKTGQPVSGTKSVTIICPDAELADALATSVFILGEHEGLDLVNRLKEIECIIINDNDEIKTSKNLELDFYETE